MKFPAFCRTRMFITPFTCARRLSLSWASSIQSIPPHPASWRLILILSSHLRLVLPSGLFPSCFPTKILYTPLLSPIRATCPPHLILFYFITRTIMVEQYRSFSCSLCSFLQSPLTSSLLGPNILLSTLFSNTLKLVEEWKTNLLSVAILFQFLCAQHVSDINISIIRSLRLCCWITTSVVFFSVRCVLENLVRLVLGGVRFADVFFVLPQQWQIFAIPANSALIISSWFNDFLNLHELRNADKNAAIRRTSSSHDVPVTYQPQLSPYVAQVPYQPQLSPYVAQVPR